MFEIAYHGTRCSSAHSDVPVYMNPVNMPTTSPDVPLLGPLYDQPFSLELLIDHLKGLRAPNCSAWIGKMDRRGEQGWSTPMLYLAVARTGSGSLNVAIGKRGAPHTHACTLPLLQPC